MEYHNINIKVITKPHTTNPQTSEKTCKQVTVAFMEALHLSG